MHEEYKRIESHKVFKPIKKKDLPPRTKILSSTWAKGSGIKRARINARGFEQQKGIHYNETGISSPVVNEASIFIILILIAMTGFITDVNDVKGAFLNGTFSNGEKLCMEVPQGFHKYYGYEVVLMLLKTMYGLKQAAYEYWKALLKAMKSLGMTKHKVDPCVYHRWTDQGLNLWASWVDDILSFGSERDVIQGREELKKHFALDEIGEMMEYVGCRIDYNKEEGSVKISQPVLIQSLKDEFDLTGVRESTSTPAAGSILIDTEAVKVDTE